jgi:hypothetical protein
MPKPNTDYNTIVKERLAKWRDHYEYSTGVKLNYAGIVDMMEKRFNIITSTTKIRDMFNIKEPREVKLSELVALCQIYDIPLWSICECPEIENNQIKDAHIARLFKGSDDKEKAIQNLKNRYYAGDYYCYYFKPKYYENTINALEHHIINEAKMNINIVDGRTIVTFEELHATLNFTGNKSLSFVLTGDLINFENPAISYTLLTHDSGRRAMALMFKFINLSSDIRYYIPMGMMTFSLNETHKPIFHKMVAFRVRQDYEDKHTSELLRGMLALNNGPIILDKQTLEMLRQDEACRRILSPDNAISNEYSVFLESALISKAYFIEDKSLKYETLLKIRSHSLYSSAECIHEDEAFATFIKHYQKNHPNHEEFVRSVKNRY